MRSRVGLRGPARPARAGWVRARGTGRPAEDLETLYCPATGELEIMRTVKTGLWYDHR